MSLPADVLRTKWEHLKEEKMFKKQHHQRAVRTELAGEGVVICNCVNFS